MQSAVGNQQRCASRWKTLPSGSVMATCFSLMSVLCTKRCLLSIVLVLLFINWSRFVKTSILDFLIRTKYAIVHQQLKQI